MEGKTLSVEFTIYVKDPDQMVVWIEENLVHGCVNHIQAIEMNVKDGQPQTYAVTIDMNDANQATLLKTVWDKG